MRSPTVSVIIPVYNQAQFIGQTIDSVLAQTFSDYEIIVVDDASTDNTAKILAGYGDCLRVITLKTNTGPAITRNIALGVAQGEFIAFLDSDDMWYLRRLDITVSYLRKNLNVDLVCGAWDHIDEAGRTIEKLNQPSNYQPQVDIDFLRTLVVRGNLLATSALLIRRKCFECCGLFDTNLKRSMDWDLWLRMAAHGHKIAMIDQPVSRYRRHQTNLTLNPQRMEEATRQVLVKLFSNDQLAVRLADLQEHAYIDSWLRLAGLAHEAGLEKDTHRFIQMARELYPKAVPNYALSFNYLEKLFLLPAAEEFMLMIATAMPEVRPLYSWMMMRRYLQKGDYKSASLKLCKLAASRPGWLLEKATRRIRRELVLVRNKSVSIRLN
ncbi:MAG: glycosyltransferase [Anaerolineales bacterium]|nr:glycosyltransferase [Anaerolineales bacterium]